LREDGDEDEDCDGKKRKIQESRDEEEGEMKDEETIVGIASGLVPAGVGVIRVSGHRAVTVAETVFEAADGKRLGEHLPRQMVYGTIREAGTEKVLDKCLAVWFRAPHSYTGEDVVEFHCHGNPLILRRVQMAVCGAGARPAEAGEFTRRAFLNGRMDLAQAEAVAALVQALTERAQSAALRNLDGALSREIRAVRDELLSLMAALEVVVEYADEDLEEVPTEAVKAVIGEAMERLEGLIATYREGRILKEGATVALAGKPNVGKSSLLNRLAGEERAIVSPVPGTTRDYIETWVKIGGLPVRLVDTAGLRESAERIEELGVERAQKVMETADLVLFVVDGSAAVTSEDERAYEKVKKFPHLVVLNKCDLGIVADFKSVAGENCETLEVSAVTGAGVSGLMERIEERLLGEAGLSTEGAMILEARHRQLAEEAVLALKEAQSALDEGLPRDLVSVSVRSAVSALSRITGDEVTEDILDRIFSTFCVGK